MKCELCRTHKAECVLHRSEKNGVQELYVCAACHEKATQTPSGPEETTLDGLMNDMLDSKVDFETFMKKLKHASGSDTFKAILDNLPLGLELQGRAVLAHGEPCCKACGMSRRKLREHQRLGCPQCYAALSHEVGLMIRDMHPWHAGDEHRRQRPPRWRQAQAPAKEPEGAYDVVLSTRVRFARNLKGFFFPDWAAATHHRRVLAKVRRQVAANPFFANKGWVSWDGSSMLARLLLVEEGVASKEMLENGCHADVYRGGEGLNILVNEEDHLRIQGYAKGYALEKAYQTAKHAEAELAGGLTFARDPELQHLTACPSNIGSGMRCSVKVQLTGLAANGELDAVIRALERMDYVVRGFTGEDSESPGHIYQVSNQGTFGAGEEDVLADFGEVIDELICQERWARQELLLDRRLVLDDCLARTLALVSASRLLTSLEAMDHLASLRMGLQLGLVEGATDDDLTKAMVDIQPAHLARDARHPALLNDDKRENRDRRRADLVRRRFSHCTLKNDFKQRRS